MKKFKVEKYANYAKDSLGIPFINFNDLDESIIYEMLRCIKYFYNKYPKMVGVLCSIGVCEDINSQLNMLVNSNPNSKIKWLDLVIEDDTSIEFLSDVIYSKNLFISKPVFSYLVYSSEIIGTTLDEFNGLLKDAELDCDYSLKHIIFHEFGHILAGCLNLNKDVKLKKIIKKYTNNYEEIGNKISSYVESIDDEDIMIGEAIAESFAFYTLSKNKDELSDVIKFIVEYIEYKYNKLKDGIKFNLNNKYLIKNEDVKVLKKNKYFY